MATLSTTDAARLQHAIDSLVLSTAPQIPFDSALIWEVARVAASTGFQPALTFQQNAQNSPISTLLSFIKFIGT